MRQARISFRSGSVELGGRSLLGAFVGLGLVFAFVGCGPATRPGSGSSPRGSRGLPATVSSSAAVEPSSVAPTEPPAATAAPDSVTTASGRRAAVPEDHVKDKHGVFHKKGYKDPLPVCTPCHGDDLKGSGGTPSCYKCHGKKWH
jgi:hypothetical protein